MNAVEIEQAVSLLFYEAVQRIQDGTIADYLYNPQTSRLERQES